jgi:hypothetical protein
MTPESKQSHSWVRIGATYGGVVDGAITALVYQTAAQRGNKGGPGGEQAEAGPGWYLVWVDEPHRHFQLSAHRARAGAAAPELDKSVLAALAEAGEAIEAKLTGGGNHANGR